jgi:proton-dependent oligopeptide transporter, POT family
LSAMTKLAPVRFCGLIMGIWFLATSLGNYIAGRLASLYETFSLPNLFGLGAAITIGLGLVLALLVRPIRRMIGAPH